MEYEIEKEQKVHKLDKKEKIDIAVTISENYKRYDEARQSQLDKANKLIEEVYFKNSIKKPNSKSKEWRSTTKTRKLFMYSQILKAFIWKNTYANINSMFDISGENLESDDNSNKQKTMLVNVMENMEYSKTLDKILDKSLIYGDLISFSTWKKQEEEYRRPISFFDTIQNLDKIEKIAKAKSKGEHFYVDTRTVYDNPYTYAVDPANFVFDSTQIDTWDSCPKIYKTWKTPDYIINNKYYEVSKEVAEELKHLVQGGSDEGDVSSMDGRTLRNQYVNGSTVEMLEHWGDLTLKDGTVLKNWYAVVVAGKYLIRFEKNPIVVNPFTYGCYFQDPENGRGISPLYAILELANTQEEMLRRTMDLQSLSENPPVYAGKGFFGKNPGDIDLNPGKIIEYDNNLYTTIPVQPMQFDANVFKDDLGYLDDLMSEISGIFPNMAGASESERTTATEISTKVEGQLTRLKMVLDIINQYLILPNIKVIAKLKANFTYGEEKYFVNNQNVPQDVVVDDNVRQAEYRYTYSDRSATSERFNFVDMVAQSIPMFAKFGLQANVQELFIWYMEQKGVENPERFLQMDLISPEVQQMLLQNPEFAQMIQQMQMQVEQQKEGSSQPQGEVDESFNIPQLAQQGGMPSQEYLDTINNLPGRNLMGNG